MKLSLVAASVFCAACSSGANPEPVRSVQLFAGYGPPTAFYFAPGIAVPVLAIESTDPNTGDRAFAYGDPIRWAAIPQELPLDAAPCAADAGDISARSCPNDAGCFTIGVVSITTAGDWRPAVLTGRDHVSGSWDGQWSDVDGAHAFFGLPQCNVTVPLGDAAYLKKPSVYF